MKKLIAYSSVAHMAFVTFGLFAFNRQGIEGAMIVMLSHGLVSGALFLCVGVIYDRMHTREIERYGGLPTTCRAMPCCSCCSPWQRRPAGHQRLRRRVPGADGHLQGVDLGAIVATTGIILGAAYMLYLYWRIAYGRAHAEARRCPTSTAREWGCSRRSPRWCCGWASIPKASWRRCATTSAGC
jgi:NADH-quinone oxidoreductase subunit M